MNQNSDRDDALDKALEAFEKLSPEERQSVLRKAEAKTPAQNDFKLTSAEQQAVLQSAATIKARDMRILRHRTKHMYDVQKLRIAASNRESSLTAELTDEDKLFFGENADMLEGVEKHVLRDLKARLEKLEIAQWLMSQRGIKETMAAVLVSYFDIEKCSTVSKMWRWAGLAIMDGEAERLRKGERAHFDPWLKSKVVAVLGGNLIKAVGKDPSGYYTSANFPNPFYSGDKKKPAAAKKKPGRKKKDASEELAAALKADASLDTSLETGTYDPDEKFIVRLSHAGEPTDDELRSVNAPAWKKTVQVRRPYAGLRDDPNGPPGATATTPWRYFYDNYKNRKENERVAICAGCGGTGRFKLSKKEAERLGFLEKLDPIKLRPEELSELADLRSDNSGKNMCKNCNGTGGPAPWGRSPAHRHAAAQRYMVKMFLTAFWERWRRLEDLPVRPSYAEEYLGRVHHR